MGFRLSSWHSGAGVPTRAHSGHGQGFEKVDAEHPRGAANGENALSAHSSYIECTRTRCNFTLAAETKGNFFSEAVDKEPPCRHPTN
jgi:hypothetical protein